MSLRDLASSPPRLHISQKFATLSTTLHSSCGRIRPHSLCSSLSLSVMQFQRSQVRATNGVAREGGRKEGRGTCTTSLRVGPSFHCQCHFLQYNAWISCKVARISKARPGNRRNKVLETCQALYSRSCLRQIRVRTPEMSLLRAKMKVKLVRYQVF